MARSYVVADPHEVHMIEVSSLVLFANDLEAAAAFYRAVGVPLEDEDHEEGPVHVAAEVAGVHFAIYPADAGGISRAPVRGSAGSDFPGFYVDSLNATAGLLRDLGAAFLDDHQTRPWGCRVVVLDPDGRAVEINQRGHCR